MQNTSQSTPHTAQSMQNNSQSTQGDFQPTAQTSSHSATSTSSASDTTVPSSVQLSESSIEPRRSGRVQSTHFASIYFDDDVQSRGTRICRNLNDGDIDPNLPITLSIFNRPGRSMGKRKTRYLSAEEYFAAHQYVLLNCEEVQPILRLYEKGLRRYNPGCTDQDVHSPMNNVCNQSLIDLACGPIMEPYDGHRKIIESITQYFPEAFKTFRSAPQSMRDIWFNEYKKSCKWNPEDEATIWKIYEKSAAKRLSDTLSQVRANLRDGKSPPKWMSDAVLAQYQTLWDNAYFKRLFDNNKKNRNSDCGGMGPSLHTGATCGLKKGGYVFGFGSDTQHYFSEVAMQKKSTYGGSSSHVACDERIGQLEKTKDEILEQNKIIIELLHRAHPELLQSITQCS
nr:putative transposase En/Spm [Ipomoea batatas]